MQGRLGGFLASPAVVWRVGCRARLGPGKEKGGWRMGWMFVEKAPGQSIREFFAEEMEDRYP